MDWPAVSIVIPCRNEVGYIGACLDSILASEYPRERLEVVIADGMSDDGTRDIIARYAAAHGWIRLLDNPQRITPCAMNLAIRAAAGEIIVRMDAHAIYPPEYVTRLVRAHQETGAENVGTPVDTLPANDTPMARAIAVGLSHRLGVGNSHFRVGTAARRWVDHVPFGCWSRELFDRIGLFDEDLPRDQDVEFNTRLLNGGGRILLLPDVTSGYHARGTISQLRRMLYQYGYFKPLVARKAKRIVTVRQVVPSLFVLGLAGSAMLIPWSAPAGWVFAAIAGAYGILVAGAVWQTALRYGWRPGLALVAVLPTMHVSYGVGYLTGLADHMLPFRRARRAATAVALSR